MRKRYLKIYILVVIIVTIVMFTTPLLVNRVLTKKSDEIYFLNQYTYNGQLDSMNERKLSPNEIGNQIYEAKIDRFDLPKGDLTLIIPRIRGAWHKIYFNNVQIGVIGSENCLQNHLWNGVYQFHIPSEYIIDENYVTFESYSEYKLGFGDMPAFITRSLIANRIFYLLSNTYSNFYMLIIGVLASFAFLEILLFFFTKNHDNHFILYPIGVLLVCIYLLDYVVVSHPSISELLYKKIIILSLYASATVISYGLSDFLNFKALKWLSIGFFSLSFVIISFASTLINLSFLYNRLNFLLVLLIISWSIIAFKYYTKEKNMLFLLISVSFFLLFLPSLYDTLMLYLMNGRHSRLSVYGIVYFSLAILFISLFKYLEEQKQNYSDSQYFELESKRLKKALITDDLTGIYNHRYFFDLFQTLAQDNEEMSIALLDIDKFRPINEIRGHTIGDKILKEISSLMCYFVGSDGYVFRYGGEEFAIIYLKDDIEVICNEIRVEVLKNQLLQDWSGYLPLTVSIGIVNYPLDGVEPKTLIDKCESAVNFGKLHGKNKVFTYDDRIKEKLEGNETIELKDKMLVNFINTLASVIDMKDPYTGKHSEEVSRYSMLIGDALQLDESQSYALRMGGMLHDFGKLSIPDHIICKNGRLTDEEYDLIKSHPKTGYDIVKHIFDDNEVLECVRNHHERYDGKGYPDQLKSTDIPLLARIICVADSYHAMISNRSYRKSLGHDYAVNELIKNKGTQFDAEIVDVFLSVLEK